MSSSLKNLSDADLQQLPSARSMHFGIVVAEWHKAITGALLKGCYDTLLSKDATPENIHHLTVPGSFELPAGALLCQERFAPDAVICLGCIIKGETNHNEYIAQAVANGLIHLSLRYNKPFVFGVLTTDTLEQAKARAGGSHGNKGIEAAVTALKMVALKKQ